MRAKKLEPDAICEAIARVQPFVCADPARTHMNSAFHCGLWGRPFVCATDGHTAAIVHCPGANADTIARPPGAERPPPLDVVISKNAEKIGEICASKLECLRGFPAKWKAIVDFARLESPRLNLSREVRHGKKTETIQIVTAASLPFANPLEVSTAVQVCYLLRALDFCADELVTVWREGDDEEAPILFSTGSDGYQQATRVAIVMPCRR